MGKYPEIKEFDEYETETKKYGSSYFVIVPANLVKTFGLDNEKLIVKLKRATTKGLLFSLGKLLPEYFLFCRRNLFKTATGGGQHEASNRSQAASY